MSRVARKTSETNIYHIVLHSINHQRIFEDTEDFNKFITISDHYRKQLGLIQYAWCIIPNHVHILVKERSTPVSQVMQRIQVSFVYWYNNKYQRSGQLFDGRFYSEPVEDSSYFLKVVRYIHLNPVKHGITRTPDTYPFSSYSYYFESNRYDDTDILFGLIQKDEFKRFHEEKNEDIGLDIDEKKIFRKTDEEICQFAKNYIGIERLSLVNNFSKPERAIVIQKLLHYGASIRQISRLTGVSITIIREIKSIHM